MGEIIDFLHDWASIIIAVISLITGTMANVKNSKQDSEYREGQKEFEIAKEEIRKHDRKIDEVFMRLNSRSNLIPYFHLILDDSKIERVNVNRSEHIKLQIGLINIGRESASNIMMYPMGEGSDNYIQIQGKGKDIYSIYDYLNQYYAFPREYITFSIAREIPKEKDGRIADCIKFKIRFTDLLGNLYEQEFVLYYDNYIVNGFSEKNSSSVPCLIEEIKYDEITECQ